MLMKPALLTFLVLTPLQSPNVSQQFGSISGEVLDARGVPIAQAKVFDEPLNSVRIGKDHFAISDGNGHFLLEDVPIGKTMVIATKVEDGYPDARYAVFSGNEVLPIVDVRPRQVTTAVVVKLQVKGGTLLGKIVNSRSGAQVPDARIFLAQIAHSERFIETDPARDGTFEFVIPSIPMRLTVAAPSFRTWNFESSSFSPDHRPLILSPESRREILISLEPLT